MIIGVERINGAFQACHFQAQHVRRINLSRCPDTVHLEFVVFHAVAQLLHGKLRASENGKLGITRKADISTGLDHGAFHPDGGARDIRCHDCRVGVRINGHCQAISPRCNGKAILSG